VATQRKLQILIVDDEPSTRYLLAQIFAARGFIVRSAAEGFEALQQIQQSPPDALLSDLNMPGMSGFELLSVVRRLYPQIRVIATSGAYRGDAVPNGIAADGFHEKATGMEKLLHLIAAIESDDQTHLFQARQITPLWVDLERKNPDEQQHVLINCPLCLRPFREPVTEIHARIRQAYCLYCTASVAYALALASLPPQQHAHDEPAPSLAPV
jgi:CheY-like chemotaxis protein